LVDDCPWALASYITYMDCMLATFVTHPPGSWDGAARAGRKDAAGTLTLTTRALPDASDWQDTLSSEGCDEPCWAVQGSKVGPKLG
jgi:hypothetical protein